MAMAMTLREYLRSQDIDYEEVRHPRAVSADHIAEQAHITGDQLAKAVMLHSDTGNRLAVVPGSCDVDMVRLTELMHEPLRLASEEEIQHHFDDCDPGATTPLGQAYGLEVWVDERLSAEPDIYFEAGDHETLVHMSGRDFQRLMADMPHGHFSLHH